MIDGKHAGTGGGNHVVVGGATPLDSPFLRRPDLLKSLVTYWLRRPSLSYLFSGLFIGPTSQAPRIDEARHDSLYELEIALAQIPKPGEGAAPRPWLLDRLMRNILTDVTGNTHRAEICIDKLYSPDGPTGRLGLVEFRGFEMPPDPRMSLAQQLLVRAIIARLWREPIEGPLPRWGSSLHDRFMLGHYRLGGFPRRARRPEGARLRRSAPTGTRRRPSSASRSAARSNTRASSSKSARRSSRGTCSARPARSAARRATPTVRPSACRSSSRPPIPSRYVVACNRRRVPLRETATEGVAVGAVRYKAWQPAMAMHPVSSGPRAAGVRHLRHLERAGARRLRLSRRPSGRAQLRHFPGQQQRGRGAAARAVRAARPFARRLRAAARGDRIPSFR